MYADLLHDVTHAVKDKMAALKALFSLLSNVDHAIILTAKLMRVNFFYSILINRACAVSLLEIQFKGNTN